MDHGPAGLPCVQQKKRSRVGAKVGAQSAADAILTAYTPQILNAAMQAGICLDLTVGIDYCAMTMARFLTDQNTAFSRVKVEPCRRGPDIENLFITVASAFTSAL